MATAEHIKSLIRSFSGDDRERFITTALQIAAHEAKQGHSALAHDIRDMINREHRSIKRSLKVIPFPKELSGLVLTEEPEISLSRLVITAEQSRHIHSVLSEYRQQSKLKAHGLCHRRKLLLVGPPGTGKTLTAKVLAYELRLPLHIIQVDRLVTKFMGETSAKLRQIFDLIKTEHGVYLFDEFDAIGGDRSIETDVGEMRRVLNAFLQFIEQDQSDSLIVAATNNPKLLDQALFRRFDDVVHYQNPDEKQRKALIENLLGQFKGARFGWKAALQFSEGLSHAEIDSACRDAIKTAILTDREQVTALQLTDALQQRQRAYKGR